MDFVKVLEGKINLVDQRINQMRLNCNNNNNSLGFSHKIMLDCFKGPDPDMGFVGWKE